MRLIPRIVPFFIVGLILLSFNSPAKADVNIFKDMGFPEISTPEWAVGQSSTYNMKLSGIEDLEEEITADIRFAIVGEEKIDGKKYHWLETDVSNMQGLPAAVSCFFTSLRFKVLTTHVKPEKYNEDFVKVLEDFADGNIVKKIVFQINEDTPKEVDFKTFSHLFGEFTGEDFRELIEEIPIEEMKKENIPDCVKIDSGKEDVKSPAGSFSNAQFVSFKLDTCHETVECKVNGHDKVPIIGLLKHVLHVKDAGENIMLSIDLIGYEMKGAKSFITGTPVPFDSDQLTLLIDDRKVF